MQFLCLFLVVVVPFISHAIFIALFIVVHVRIQASFSLFCLRCALKLGDETSHGDNHPNNHVDGSIDTRNSCAFHDIAHQKDSDDATKESSCSHDDIHNHVSQRISHYKSNRNSQIDREVHLPTLPCLPC